MKPGSLCRLGDRSVFKVGYVLGPSRAHGKTRVRSYSASADAWSNAFAIDDGHVMPLPARDMRTDWQSRVINGAVLSSAKARQTARREEVATMASNRPIQRVPGYNVDRIDVAAGLRELTTCGYDDPRTVMVIKYALQRWALGEEDAAQRGAIDRSFHGVNLTCWFRVLSAARAHAEQTAAGAAKESR